MRRYIDHVLAILPFEPASHARLGGPPCTFVGHPLTERIGELRPSIEEARRRQAQPAIVLVLPGSRTSEIRRLLAPFGAALALVTARAGPLELVLPTLPHLLAEVTAATATWPQRPRIIVDAQDKHAAFRTARVALAASGTVTLELAIAGVPTVAAYRVPLWEGVLARLVATVNTAILTNLVLGENVVPEFHQRECVPDRIAGGLVPLLGDGPQRRRQTEAFARLDAIMELGSARPSQKAADVVLDVIAAGRGT
jgi:lipid-A-disaccharide synthase